jgi:sterol desaturase/sphingolipid hydroxylase (fatty acid hydroxylase superfamily)
MTGWAQSIAGEWLESTGVDVARYVIFAVAVWLVLWVALRNVLRARKIRLETPPARQLVVEFLVSIRSIAIFSTVGISMFLLERAGLLPGPALAAQWGMAWGAASLVLMIIAHDAYFYWTHRLMHDPRLFRRMHRRHHRSHNPSPFTAYSFDLAEAAVLASFVPLWMILVPTPWPVTGLFMLHQIVRNTLGHSGYELMPANRNGRPLLGFLTTTTHHDLHHAEAGWNYGLYFTWWDKMMGTEHPDYHARFASIAQRKRSETSPALRPAKAAAALALAIACAGLAPRTAEAQTSADIAGRWATPGFGSIVEFSPCANASDAICGRILWLWGPNDSAGRPRTDSHNPDRALRSRPLVGVELVHGLRQTAPGVWSNGALYNPDDGRTYAGAITLKEGLLELKGCALNVFCQTQTWRRAVDVLAAAGAIR